MSIEAMKTTYAAMTTGEKFGDAIDALRAAIQQAEAQQPATPEPVKAAPYNPTEEMRRAMKRIDPALSSEQCRALWSAAWSAAPSTHPAPSVPATGEPVQADSSEHLRVISSLGAALRRLSFAAQTTGGTDGPDAELQSAIGQAEQALSLGGLWQAMSATTEPVEDGIRNAEDELNCAEEVLDAITCEFSDGEFPVTDFNCIGDYITAVVDVFKERLAAQQPATSEPVQTTPNFTQLMQILDGLNRCHSRDSKVEFLRSWIRDWTQHKVDKLTHPAPSEPDDVVHLRNALILAANRLDRLTLELKYDSQARADAIEWASDAMLAAKEKL